MYEQHPVPQQISSYSFKLVGEMTLKQFFEIAGGAVVALIIYSLPILGLVKWPLVIMSALSGAAFAFLPIQDRPLEQWLSAFFRSIYSPTVYIWKRSTQPHIYFQPEGTPQPQVAPAQVLAQVAKMPEKPSEPEYITQLDKTEEAMLDQINALMAQAENQQAQTTKPVPIVQTQIAQPVVQQVQAPTQQVVQAYVPTGSNGSVTVNTTPQVVVQTTASTPKPAPLIVPRVDNVELNKKGYQQEEQHVTQKVEASDVKQVLSTSKDGDVVKAQFSIDAAPPVPPEQPNILVGQVMDSEGKIIEGAILEIKDNQGRPVRALKTNRAGHFMIVTQLPDGDYEIIAEKEGFKFQPIEVSTKGEIVAPIAIHAEK